MFREIDGSHFSERALARRKPQHDSLLQAWRLTHYEVSPPGGFTLKVDEPSPALRAFHRAAEVDSSAFLTAYNPLSRAVPPAVNAAAHERLADAIRRLGLEPREGQGRDPSGAWSPERSLLVPGLPLASAAEIGAAFAQAAFLWSCADATPRLYVLDWPP